MVEKIYQPSEKHPFGRVRKDSIAQPFRSKNLAAECAYIMSRMTGDDCYVEQRGSVFYLVRNASDYRQVLA